MTTRTGKRMRDYFGLRDEDESVLNTQEQENGQNAAIQENSININILNCYTQY